jgi:hypothetical protein
MVAVARLQVALPRLPGFFVCPATPKNSGPPGSFRQLPESVSDLRQSRRLDEGGAAQSRMALRASTRAMIASPQVQTLSLSPREARAGREPEGFLPDSPNANERDPRSVAELAFGEASSGGAEFCAPASLKISFAGQSLDRLAHGAARKKSVASIARLASPTCWPPIVPKQPYSMFNPRARADTNSQRQSVQWAGRRCCAAGYDGRAATRPYRLGNVPIIIGKWNETIAGRGEGFPAPRESEQES